MSASAERVELAVTIRLPWAAAIRHGVKRVENRGRPVPDRHIGRLIGIHAGAAWDRGAARDPRLLDWWYGPDAGDRYLDATDFAPLFRNVIAVARLVDYHDAEQPVNPILVAEGATCCSPWGERWHGADAKPAWHLVLDDIVMLDEPVGPVAGQLAVPWTLPEPVSATVTSAYARSAR